jgi:hypothetical protein
MRDNYYKSLVFFLLQQYGNTADDNLQGDLK